MIGYITREKELRQKELMKMMSVTESDIGWAWFMSFYLFHIVTATIVALLSIKLYVQSSGFFLWIFWMLTFLVTVVFAMAVSALSSKSTRGVLIGLLLFFIGVFFTIAINYQSANGGLVKILSLHPVAAFSFGIQEIGSLEDKGVGVTSSTYNKSDYSSGYTFQDTIRLLILDSVLWGVAAWYLNRVIRPDYGQAQSLLFPCQALFNCFRSKPSTSEYDDNQAENSNDAIPYEPVGGTLQQQAADNKTIEIRGLRMQFGEKTAVDGMTLSMYNGQVTALLGVSLWWHRKM